METSNIIPSVSFQMMTHTTPVLFTRFGYYWWNSWSRGSRTSQRSITFLMVVVGTITISKTSLIYVSIKRTFPSRQSGFSFQLATGNGPVMELVVQWNIILQNEVCTDHSTTTFWTICGAGSMSRTFFGIDKEDMVEVREKMEKRFEDGTWYKKQSSFHSPVSIANWTQTVQWEWLICGHPWLENSNSSWYWWHCSIVLHLLHV